jgi:CheY-like chemotaxis protein
MNLDGQQAKIMIVDDEEIIRIGVQRILEDANLTVDEAANGLLGWEKIKAKPDYDLVLLDLMMPEMGGLEVLEEIQEPLEPCVANRPHHGSRRRGGERVELPLDAARDIAASDDAWNRVVRDAGGANR